MYCRGTVETGFGVLNGTSGAFGVEGDLSQLCQVISSSPSSQWPIREFIAYANIKPGGVSKGGPHSLHPKPRERERLASTTLPNAATLPGAPPLVHPSFSPGEVFLPHLVREAESACCILTLRWLIRRLEQRKSPHRWSWRFRIVASNTRPSLLPGPLSTMSSSGSSGLLPSLRISAR